MLQLLRRAMAARGAVRRLGDVAAWEEPWDYEEDGDETEVLRGSAALPRSPA